MFRALALCKEGVLERLLIASVRPSLSEQVMDLRNTRQMPGGNQHWVVAIDFGTTFSAVACCNRGASIDSTDAGKIKAVQRYTSKGGLRLQEVPTELRYEDGNVVRWGYGVRCALEPVVRDIPGLKLTRFKLLLDEDPNTCELRSEIWQDLAQIPGDHSDVSVITDYLAKLLEHTKDFMETSLFMEKDAQVDLVCTVPAMWNQRAIRKMIKALECAQLRLKKSGNGFQRDEKDVYLVYEPEAATAYIMSTNQNIGLQVCRL